MHIKCTPSFFNFNFTHCTSFLCGTLSVQLCLLVSRLPHSLLLELSWTALDAKVAVSVQPPVTSAPGGGRGVSCDSRSHCQRLLCPLVHLAARQGARTRWKRHVPREWLQTCTNHSAWLWLILGLQWSCSAVTGDESHFLLRSVDEKLIDHIDQTKSVNS